MSKSLPIKDYQRKKSSDTQALTTGDVYHRISRIYPRYSAEVAETVTFTLSAVNSVAQTAQTFKTKLERSESRLSQSVYSNQLEVPSLEGSLRPETKVDIKIGRESSVALKEAASLANQAKKIQVWPEWSDADVNAEKWDAQVKAKGNDKGKSPVGQHFFDDPEGKIELPPSVRVTHWKRPSEFILEKTPTVVDTDEGQNSFDILTPNEVCSESELVRYIISEIISLWRMHEVKTPTEPGSDSYNAGVLEEVTHNWKPWEHIYAINKVAKIPVLPAYNPYGKYVVKLWWMGCWRKIIVDDLIPFDDAERPLLPMTSLGHELWPVLLTKALVKIAALDYNGGNSSCEFGDFSPIHCLTGWLPETIPLQFGHLDEIWSLLRDIVPQFTLPELPSEKGPDQELKPESAAPESGLTDDTNAEQPKDGKDAKKVEKADVKTAKGKEKGKDGKSEKKDKEKEKDKHKEAKPEEFILPEKPEMAVFASFVNVTKYPPMGSAFGEAADTSERLRQNHISHLYPHPVWLKQTRDCPLERPPPEEVIPPWKLIRPRVPKLAPSDEPRAAPEAPKPIRCVEITSPYINYKVNPISIPTELHRPHSVLERGGTRPGTSNVPSIMEADENAGSQGTVQQTNKVLNDSFEQVLKAEADKPSSGKSGVKAVGKLPKIPPAEKTTSKKDDDKTAAKSGKKEQPQKVEDKKGKKERTDSAKTMKSEAKGRTDGHAADDTTTPVTPQGEDGGLSEAAGTDEALEPQPMDEAKKHIWMDFEMFCKCFKTLTVYHKPLTYPFKAQHTDNLKGALQQPANNRSDKKLQTVLYNDEAPRFLFVDSLKPSEIIVSFTSFSHWVDNQQASIPIPAPSQSNPSHTAVNRTGKESKDIRTPDKSQQMEVTSEQASYTTAEYTERERLPIAAGVLIAEHHSWKSLAIGHPVLRIRTTATKAAALTLPPGRHVLKFHMTAPLGYFIHLVSSTEFTFGDEEDVMPKLKSESLRYKDSASKIILNLCKCMQSINDRLAFIKAWDVFEESHCPYRNDKHISKTQHYKSFMEALYATLKKSISPELLTLESAFAIRSLFIDATSSNILGLLPSSRPATGASASHRGSAKDKKDKGKSGKSSTLADKDHHANELSVPGDAEKIPDRWIDHEATVEEMLAQVRISKCWRGYFVRRLLRARTPESDLNTKTHECLLKIAQVLEPQAESIGLNLLRQFLKSEPDLLPKYPFYIDEWNKISFNDFSGSYPDQPANTWFIIFREVFFVTEDTLCVPKVYMQGGLNTCLLRVVDNDTGSEIPRVFQKVAPHVYKRNKRGYTFVAEGRTTDSSISGNKWKMRLIGSMSVLPTPTRPEVQSSFYTREIRDYYLPQDNRVMLRYTVRVLEENHLVSLQLNTSKPDVYVKLQILDNEEELVSSVGKGHVVLPAFIFLKDSGVTDDNDKRPNSRMSTKGIRGKGTKRSTSVRRGSHSSVDDVNDEEESKEVRPHKYVIQAIVLRDSWPLSQSQWAFVQELKEKEKEELKAGFDEVQRNKDREQSPSGQQMKESKTPQGTAKGGKPKGKEKSEKTDKSKAAGGQASRPPSVSFDISKPHWTLRVVSDAPASEEIEVKRDTERADEIRAMKRAWEEAEPGRAAKAQASRLRYLASHMIKVADDEEEETHKPPATSMSNEEDDDTVYTTNPPPGLKPKEILQPLDVTPFLRRFYDTPRYKDEEEDKRQMEARQSQIQEFKLFRERVERWRDDDRLERNKQKQQQLEECERLQALLDDRRAEINMPREAFRQKYLEAERKRLEALAAEEAAIKAEAEKAVPSPKGKKSGKSAKDSGKAAKKK